ncbi:regulatory protein MerR [Lentilactobacillus parakefiri DSM 10551]|nr:regulatory protein MerR [Lentilactobacillus parakefiri DSM 10551]
MEIMAELSGNDAFIDTDKLIFGIGQVQQITGVSGRQLRYWEEQGYIQSLNQKKGAAREYSLHTLFFIFHVTRFLDDGFTLQSAVDKAKQFDRQLPVLRQFLREQLHGVDFQDDRSILDFGYVDSSHTQRIYGIVKNGETSFEIKNVE